CAEQHHHYNARLYLALEFDHSLVVPGALELGVATMERFRAEPGQRRVRVLDNHQLVVVVEEQRVTGLGRVVNRDRLGLDLAYLDHREAGRWARIARVVLRRGGKHLDHVGERTETGHQVADLLPAPQHGRIVKRFDRKRGPRRYQHKDDGKRAD